MTLDDLDATMLDYVDLVESGRDIAAICPGLVDTPTSRPWFTDMSGAQAPHQATAAIMPLALEPVRLEHYGQLVQFGRVIPGHNRLPDRHCAQSSGRRPRLRA
jgi:hypothetical protein